MVWIDCLEKFLKLIGRLPCLALKITLGSSDVFSSELSAALSSSSSSPVMAATCWGDAFALFVAFGTSLGTLASSFGRCPMAATEDWLPITLDKNSPDCLLIRGVPVVISSSSIVVFG
jgi:hypothetical protein